VVFEDQRSAIHPDQSDMTTEASHYRPSSTHDEFLARRQCERGHRAGDDTPKLMSSLDYEPAARAESRN
jgi:hypothetical protein